METSRSSPAAAPGRRELAPPLPADGQHIFKILEIELGMMYDNLYTKATRKGWFEHGLGLYSNVSLTFHW